MWQAHPSDIRPFRAPPAVAVWQLVLRGVAMLGEAFFGATLTVLIAAGFYAWWLV